MNRKIRGVALIVKNPQGEILILKEFESNPRTGKVAGMFSIPMETVENQEDDGSALIRLIEEELPGFEAGIKIEKTRIGVYRVLPQAWASLYVGSMTDSSLPGATREVGEHRWIKPANALDLSLRQGTKEMITDYISGITGMVRVCEPVSIIRN